MVFGSAHHEKNYLQHSVFTAWAWHFPTTLSYRGHFEWPMCYYCTGRVVSQLLQAEYSARRHNTAKECLSKVLRGSQKFISRRMCDSSPSLVQPHRPQDSERQMMIWKQNIYLAEQDKVQQNLWNPILNSICRSRLRSGKTFGFLMTKKNPKVGGSSNQVPVWFCHWQPLSWKEQAASHSDLFTFSIHGCAFLI